MDSNTNPSDVPVSDPTESMNCVDSHLEDVPLELKEAIFPDEPGFPVQDKGLLDDDSDTSSFSDDDLESCTLTGDYEKDHAMFTAMMDDGEDMMINQPRTKHEIDPESIPVEPVARVPASSLLPLGIVFSLLDRTLVVKTPGAGLSDSDSDDDDNAIESSPQNASSGPQEALDVGTAIFTADGTPLGRIDDIIGAVECPFYVVRQAAELGVAYPLVEEASNSKTAPDADAAAMTETEARPPTRVAAAGCPELPRLRLASLKSLLVPHTQLYYCARAAAFVPQAQLHLPGSDASNLFDEEVADDQQEFSDDEQEQAHRRQKTAAQQAARAAAGLPAKAGKNKGRQSQRQGQALPQHPPMPPPPASWRPQQPQPQPQQQMGAGMHAGMFNPPAQQLMHPQPPRYMPPPPPPPPSYMPKK